MDAFNTVCMLKLLSLIWLVYSVPFCAVWLAGEVRGNSTSYAEKVGLRITWLV